MARNSQQELGQLQQREESSLLCCDVRLLEEGWRGEHVQHQPNAPSLHKLQLEVVSLVRHRALSSGRHHQGQAALQRVQGQTVAAGHEQLLQLLLVRLLVAGGAGGGALDPGHSRHVRRQQTQQLPRRCPQLLAVEAHPELGQLTEEHGVILSLRHEHPGQTLLGLEVGALVQVMLGRAPAALAAAVGRAGPGPGACLT